MFRRALLPILLATVWISVSEFVRNSFLVHRHWTEHYGELGLIFPEASVNGAVWGLWSLAFASLIFLLGRRFSLAETVGVAWLAGFVLMWLVVGNMGVLPYGILPLAIPLSLLETAVAAWIIARVSAPRS